MPERQISIMVAVPSLHWIHKSVVDVLLRLQNDRRYDLNLWLPSYKPYENYCHHAIVRLLEGDYDFWLSIDDDNPPTKNPLDLVELDLDVVNLPTPVYHSTDRDNPQGERPVFYNSFMKAPDSDRYMETRNKNGLVEVDAIGSGCFLAARRVFEHPDMQKGCFTRLLNPDGTVERGGDISFSERARAAGFKLWSHWDYICDQFSEISMAEMVRSWHEGVIHNGGSFDRKTP